MSNHQENQPKQTSGTVTAKIAGASIPATQFSGDPDRMQMYRNEGRLTITANQVFDTITSHAFLIQVPEDLPADGKEHTYNVVGGEASGHYIDVKNSSAEFYNFIGGHITVQLNGEERLQGTFMFEGKFGNNKAVTITEGTIDLTGFITSSKAVNIGTGTFSGILTGGPAPGEFTSSTVSLSLKGGGPIPEFWLVQGIYKDANTPLMDNFINILIDTDQTDLTYDLANNQNVRTTFLNAEYGVASSISGTLAFSSLPSTGHAVGSLKCQVQKNQEPAFDIEASFDVNAIK